MDCILRIPHISRFSEDVTLRWHPPPFSIWRSTSGRDSYQYVIISCKKKDPDCESLMGRRATDFPVEEASNCGLNDLKSLRGLVPSLSHIQLQSLGSGWLSCSDLLRASQTCCGGLRPGTKRILELHSHDNTIEIHRAPEDMRKRLEPLAEKDKKRACWSYHVKSVLRCLEVISRHQLHTGEGRKVRLRCPGAGTFSADVWMALMQADHVQGCWDWCDSVTSTVSLQKSACHSMSTVFRSSLAALPRSLFGSKTERPKGWQGAPWSPSLCCVGQTREARKSALREPWNSVVSSGRC